MQMDETVVYNVSILKHEDFIFLPITNSYISMKNQTQIVYA